VALQSRLEVLRDAHDEQSTALAQARRQAGKCLSNRSTYQVKPFYLSNRSTYHVKPFYLSIQTVLPFKFDLYRYAQLADAAADSSVSKTRLKVGGCSTSQIHLTHSLKARGFQPLEPVQ
jgi:predicted GTPase